MKDSGIEWIGEIPDDWEFNQGKYYLFDKKVIAGIRADEYERLSLTLNGVVPRAKDDNDGLQPKNFNSYQILNKGELVFKLIDLQNVATSRVGISDYTGIVSPAYITLHNKANIDMKFLYYFYMMMWYRRIFNTLGDAGVRSNLVAKDLLEIKFPIPPLQEQTRIANFLDEKCGLIDSIRDKLRKEIEDLGSYRKSIITETVTKGLNPNVPMKDSGIEWLGQIPAHWEVKKVKHLFYSGKGLNITKSNLIDYGLPVISYGQIHSKDNDGVSLKPYLLRYVDWDYQSKYPQCEVYQNDFVFADTSEDSDGCGNCVYNRDDNIVYAGYHSIILHSKARRDNRYLAYLFQTDIWRKQLRENSFGVKVFSITQFNLMNSSLLLPSFEEQHEIANFLDTINERLAESIKAKQTQLTELESYKKSLIYEYVTGKKRV